MNVGCEGSCSKGAVWILGGGTSVGEGVTNGGASRLGGRAAREEIPSWLVGHGVTSATEVVIGVWSGLGGFGAGTSGGDVGAAVVNTFHVKTMVRAQIMTLSSQQGCVRKHDMNSPVSPCWWLSWILCHFWERVGQHGFPYTACFCDGSWLYKLMRISFLGKILTGGMMGKFPFWAFSRGVKKWNKSLTGRMEVSFLGNWQVNWKFPFLAFFQGAKKWHKFLTGGMEVSFLGRILTGDSLFWNFFWSQNDKKIKYFDGKYPKKEYFDGKHLKKEIFWWQNSKNRN